MKLRVYQREAIESIFSWWEEDNRLGENPLVVLPTASGKTVVFCALIQELISRYESTRIVILAHRKELVTQAEDKLLSVWPEAPVGVYAASLKRREIRLSPLPAETPSLIILTILDW